MRTDRAGLGMSSNRWIVTSLVALMAATFGGAVTAFAFQLIRPSDSELDLARSTAFAELAKLHWLRLDTLPEFRPVIEGITGDLEIGTRRISWRLKIVRPHDEPKANRTPFEMEALQRVNAGRGEFWTSRHGRVTQYAAPVRIEQNCLACHADAKADFDSGIAGAFAIVVLTRE